MHVIYDHVRALYEKNAQLRKTPAHMSRASFECATPKYLGKSHSANAYVCMYVYICVDIMLPGVIE